MDGCKSKEMTTEDREDCRKDTGGMAEDPVRGGGAVGSGRWAVGASVASGAVVSGAVVQWCPAGCCWCSGADGRWIRHLVIQRRRGYEGGHNPRWGLRWRTENRGSSSSSSGETSTE